MIVIGKQLLKSSKTAMNTKKPSSLAKLLNGIMLV